MGQGDEKNLTDRLEHTFLLTGWHMVPVRGLRHAELVIGKRGKGTVRMPTGLSEEAFGRELARVLGTLILEAEAPEALAERLLQAARQAREA